VFISAAGVWHSDGPGELHGSDFVADPPAVVSWQTPQPITDRLGALVGPEEANCQLR
jgi:hypothetical protein